MNVIAMNEIPIKFIGNYHINIVLILPKQKKLMKFVVYTAIKKYIQIVS